MTAQTLPKQFDDILLKLRRAREHAEAFNSEAIAFWKRDDIYEGRPERDRKGRRLYRVTRVDTPPPELAVYIGESAHQLRSSLDHLMWLLAKPKTAKQENDVSFPILKPLPPPLPGRGHNPVRRRRRFRGMSHTMPGVSRGVRTLVEALQPYHCRSWPHTALLGQIQAISNWDKHRTLMTTAAMTMATETHIRIEGRAELKNLEHFTPILEAGTILARFEVGDSDSGTDVYMKPETTVIPCFGKTMPKEIRLRPVYPMLYMCGRFIEEVVLPMFARFF